MLRPPLRRYWITADIERAAHCGNRGCEVCDLAVSRGHWIDTAPTLAACREAVAFVRSRGGREIRIIDTLTDQNAPAWLPPTPHPVGESSHSGRVRAPGCTKERKH